MIFDHLLRFDSEAAAQADPTVGKYWTPASNDGPGAWRGDVTIPAVSIYALDGSGNRVVFPGWFIVIALPQIDSALQALPNGGCRLIADRDAAGRGEAFLRYVAPDITPGQLAAAHVEPTFAGSRYPFGAVS